MGKKKTTTKSNETATTTPNVPSWIQQPLQDYTGKVQAFSNTNPADMVAPASPLQQQAFAGAQNLGGWQQYATQGADLAKAAAGATAPQVTGVGYTAPRLGTAPQATAAQLGAAPSYNAANIDPAALAKFQSILENGGIAKYMDPAVQSYINPALAAFDLNAGKQRAAMRAQAAGAGAFGGSRYGIQEGEFDANTALGRTQTEADLRRNAYDQALNTAMSEAGRGTQIDLSNTAAQNARAAQQAQLEQEARAANAGLAGQYGLQQGAFNQQTGLANLDVQQQRDLAQQTADQAAAQYGAGATNTANLANQAATQNDYQRQLQAALGLSDIGAQSGANTRADVVLTGDLGAQQQAIDQAQRDAALRQLQATGQLYGVLPYGSLIGQNITSSGTSTSKQSGGLLNSLLSAAAMASAFTPSDRRAKRDIERIGSHGPLGLYRYNYIWDHPDRPKRTGVMADEVAIHVPEALGPVTDGYQTVRYDVLGLSHLVEV